MKYPKEKAKVLVLAHTVNSGLKKNTTTFPSPPVTTTAMEADLDAYEAKREEITEAEAVVKQLYGDEEELYDRINSGTPRNLRYVESIADGDPGILALVGWGNPSERQPLQPPGQPRALEIVGQGDG